MRIAACSYIGAILLVGATSFGQTGAAMLMQPLVNDEELLEFRVDAITLHEGHTDSPGSPHVNLGIYEASGRVREQRDKLLPRMGMDVLYLDVHSADPILPKRLVDASFTIALGVENLNGWTLGMSVGAGYAGTTPLSEANAWYPKAMALLERDLSKKSKLVFLVDYDANHVALPDIPIPGVAYIYEPDDKSTFVIGAPFSAISWKPTDRIKAHLIYYPVDQLDVEIAYKLVEHLWAYAAAEGQQDAFHVPGLPKKHRLFFEQRRLEGGIRFEPFRDTTFTAAAGYAWGTEFTEGYQTLTASDFAQISDEPYFRLSFESRF